jgi:bacteriocin biosynthesis cyclodehydratase domain-containing protein
MAATDRVSVLDIVAVGPFGEEVARRLARITSPVQIQCVHASGDLDEDRLSGGPVIVAAWRPVPSLCMRIEALASAHRFAWLPVVCMHPQLYVGPLVIPGQQACYSCFSVRMLQHTDAPAELELLYWAYDENPDLGPRGYLPASAGLAAALALDALDRLARAPSTAAGRVLRLNLVTTEAHVATIVGCDDCPQCGWQGDTRLRSVARLAADLQEVLPQWRTDHG